MVKMNKGVKMCFTPLVLFILAHNLNACDDAMRVASPEYCTLIFFVGEIYSFTRAFESHDYASNRIVGNREWEVAFEPFVGVIDIFLRKKKSFVGFK